MQKTFIQNRSGQKICVVVDEALGSRDLVFIMHGLGGFKEQVHIQTFAKSFKEKGFTIVLFDAANTFGESEGRYEDATTTNYYEDLEDVISWSKNQDWFTEPFWLVGHSLGGISVALYAQNFPTKVKALAPISTVVSGKLSLQKPRFTKTDELDVWKETGWRIKKSDSLPGVVKRLPWSHMQDRMNYDLLEKADVLTMPVLLIVGENDDTTPLEHQQLLFNKLPSKKEIHIIKNAPHTFKDKKHLGQIHSILITWIESVQNGT